MLNVSARIPRRSRRGLFPVKEEITKKPGEVVTTPFHRIAPSLEGDESMAAAASALLAFSREEWFGVSSTMLDEFLKDQDEDVRDIVTQGLAKLIVLGLIKREFEGASENKQTALYPTKELVDRIAAKQEELQPA